MEDKDMEVEHPEIGLDKEITLEEIANYHPGEFSLLWAQGEQCIAVEEYYLDEEERKEIDPEKEVDQLFLIKWRNLSYVSATWEPLSLLSCADKLLSFRQHNRALDKDNRTIILNQVQRHKTLLELLANPRKKVRMGSHFFNEVMNRMYCYDIALHKKALQYV